MYFDQILKIFAQTMANFSALGSQPHPHTVRLCTVLYIGVRVARLTLLRPEIWSQIALAGPKILVWPFSRIDLAPCEN